MTRKDYIAIASVLRHELDHRAPVYNTVKNIATGLIDVFETDNPDFDSGTFWDACGLFNCLNRQNTVPEKGKPQ
jgi:hypothetical protein